MGSRATGGCEGGKIHGADEEMLETARKSEKAWGAPEKSTQVAQQAKRGRSRSGFKRRGRRYLLKFNSFLEGGKGLLGK